jgi:dTDP-4-dehydrorhamnose reductase
MTLRKKNILITGGSGKLGKELKKCFPTALTPTHGELDIVNNRDVLNYFTDNNISLVIHTAAMTDVRQCEENKKKANEVNVNGTKNIVNSANQVGAKVIYVSTACVFNGETAPFSEGDTPDPKNRYALTKYDAEQYVCIADKDNLVIRTNFVAYEPWAYPAAFTDRYGTYLFAHDVARAILKIKSMSGIVHVCGDKTLSMYNLARITSPNVKPMTMKDYNGPPLTRDMRLVSNLIPPFKLTTKQYSGDS